jgi:hypothetical protein
MPMDAHQYAAAMLAAGQHGAGTKPVDTTSYASAQTCVAVASNALWTLASEELYGRYTHGRPVGGWGVFTNQTSSAHSLTDRTDPALH